MYQVHHCAIFALCAVGDEGGAQYFARIRSTCTISKKNCNFQGDTSSCRGYSQPAKHCGSDDLAERDLTVVLDVYRTEALLRPCGVQYHLGLADGVPQRPQHPTTGIL
jgi:hypothetical protein